MLCIKGRGIGSTPGGHGTSSHAPPDGSQGGTRDELLCHPLTGEESGSLPRGEHGMSSHVSGERRAGDRGGRGKNKPLPPQSGGDMG